MDNQEDIIELLDILYGMVTEAWGVPLGNDKCIIEREKAIEIINDIKASLPSSIAESKRLVAARDEFIGNAKREAEALRKSAEERARTLMEEQEIVRVAKAKSAEMISSAETKSNELRRVASEYVEQIMRQTEESVSSALSTIQSAHKALQAAGGQPQRPTQKTPAERQESAERQERPDRQERPERQGRAKADRPAKVDKIDRIDRANFDEE